MPADVKPEAKKAGQKTFLKKNYCRASSQKG
jgi:hypothetical protein